MPLLLLGGLEIVLRLAGYGYSTGFFEKIRVGEKEFLVNNEIFGLRFFRRNWRAGPARSCWKRKSPRALIAFSFWANRRRAANRSRLTPRRVIWKRC
jgi:hypothetical protein